MKSGFEVMSRQCDQCLLSNSPIVSNRRRAEILRETAQRDVPFFCHKGTIADREIACRGHFERSGGGQLGRIARRLNAVIEIDPETLERVSRE